MPKKPAEAHHSSYEIAQRIEAALEADGSLSVSTPVERPGGLVEPTASFEIRDDQDRVFKVIVSRQR